MAVILSATLVGTGLTHVSFAATQAGVSANITDSNSGSSSNSTSNVGIANKNISSNTPYSNSQFGIERINLPKGWKSSIMEENNTAGTATDEVTITLQLENATMSSLSSSSSSGATGPFSLFSMFSSAGSGISNSASNNNGNNSGAAGSETDSFFGNDNGGTGSSSSSSANDPFNPTIMIKLQKGEALQRALAAEQNQTQGQDIDLFSQNPYCKPVESDNGTAIANNANSSVINGLHFNMTEQACDSAPILKLFFGAFYASFANLAKNATSPTISTEDGQTDNKDNNATSTNDGLFGSSNGFTNSSSSGTLTTSTTPSDANKFTEFMNSLHNITTTGKEYVYTSPSSDLRIKFSYSALTFISVEDFEINAKHYQRYLPVFEDMVHSVKLQK